VRVQLKHWVRPGAIAVSLCVACVPRAHAAGAADDQTFNYLLRYFTDSEHVAVRSHIGDYAIPLSPDAGLSIHWNNEKVTIPAISAPVGSQAAIDAITTASRPISGNAYQDYVKVRNEFQTEVHKGAGAMTYYVSTEPDYLAQQLAGHYSRDFSDKTFNLEVGTSYGWDDIKPLADSDTNTPISTKDTVHLNMIATQVVSPSTLVRVGVEYNQVDGLQHNPYRNVYAGGTSVPERSPDHRERRDAFFKLNQYLVNHSSLRMSYRYYNDDWGIQSHEMDATLSQYITRGVVAAYEYRYYTQTAATFFRTEYASVNGIDGYLTGDYRLGALSSSLFGAKLNFNLDTVAPSSPFWSRMGVWFNLQRYFNSNNYTANFLESGLNYRF
jgi:Protein of unknown function (DUF3570)